MKKHYLASIVALAFFSVESWALTSTSYIAISPGDLFGNATLVSENVYNPGDPTVKPVTRPWRYRDFMVNPDANQLVFIITYDPDSAFGNVHSWRLEEWTKDRPGAPSEPYDRDLNSANGIQSGIMESDDNNDADGRAFINKNLSDPTNLTNAPIVGASDLAESDGSRDGPRVRLGDHIGFFKFNGRLDRENKGMIRLINGTLYGQADLLNGPWDDEDQVIFTLKIIAKKPFTPHLMSAESILQ
jgi:hypothetical protein